MSYKLRFVQKYKADMQEAFMALEKQFKALEMSIPAFPKGKRYTPYLGRESNHTLIWECEFSLLEEALAALAFLEQDARHEALYRQQVSCFLESYTELYKSLDLD